MENETDNRINAGRPSETDAPVHEPAVSQAGPTGLLDEYFEAGNEL